MTNLDSILKSRDITLPTKVCMVKAMVSPVDMYGCESWTIKKAEPFQTVVLEKILESPLDWKKHKLESRLLGEISTTSDMQMTPPLWQKVKKN